MRLRHLTTQLDALDLAAEARRDVEAALNAVDPGFATLTLSIALYAGFDRQEAQLRSACTSFQFAAIQLADDQADRELTYLAPERAPTTQALLQTVAHACALRSRVPPAVLGELARDFLTVGATHLWEQTASASKHSGSHVSEANPWTLGDARRAAEGLNGRQFRAYFRFLMHGSELEPEAARMGTLFGHCLHVAGDFVSGDPRWLRLVEADRLVLARWAAEQAEELARYEHPPTLEQLGRIRGLLRGALEKLEHGARHPGGSGGVPER